MLRCGGGEERLACQHVQIQMRPPEGGRYATGLNGFDRAKKLCRTRYIVPLRNSGAYYWDHPQGVAVRVADVGGHLVEVGDGLIARHRRQLADGVGVAVAPSFHDRCEGFAWDADRVYQHVVHRNFLEVHSRQNREAVSADVEIGARGGGKCFHCRVPKIVGIVLRVLEMEHAVVFGDQVDIAAGPRDAGELGDYLIGVRDRMQDVAADRQIVRFIGGVEAEDCLMLEAETWRKICVSLAGKVEVGVDDVDTENLRLGKKLGEAGGGFAGPAAGVQDFRL